MQKTELGGMYVFYNNIDIVRSLLVDPTERCAFYDAMFDFVRFGSVSLKSKDNVNRVFKLFMPLLKSCRRKGIRDKNSARNVDEKKSKKCVCADKKSGEFANQNPKENIAQPLLNNGLAKLSVEQEQETRTNKKNKKEREINKERESEFFGDCCLGHTETIENGGEVQARFLESGNAGNTEMGEEVSVEGEILSEKTLLAQGGFGGCGGDDVLEDTTKSCKPLEVHESKNLVLSMCENDEKFCIPTLEEVENFVGENRLNVLPKVFFHFYNGKNWTIKNEQFDWKEKLLEWEARGAGRQNGECVSRGGGLSDGQNHSSKSKKLANERDFSGVDFSYIFDDLDDIDVDLS